MPEEAIVAFAWKIHQSWQGDGYPSAGKWALAAVGHLGDDGCVLKLTPLIRAWPGESQHARAVFGLECLRAVGTGVALVQLSGIAQKLKFKGLKAKAEQFVEEIAKDRGLTRAELEDRVVPDCGLDENGRREFSFGPRSFAFVLAGDLKAMVRDGDGKLRSDLPKPSGKDDEVIGLLLSRHARPERIRVRLGEENAARRSLARCDQRGSVAHVRIEIESEIRMAKKSTAAETPTAPTSDADLQRPAAEALYADELARLAAQSADLPRPPGWRLTPRAVLAFVIGDEKLGIAPKFVGRRAFLERCIVALATNRGLMLIGEPGTAKSYLSEFLAAAISGDSTLTIQGSAGTTEDNIRYSWNYALLVSEGPSERSLVPAPLYLGMKLGQLVRFEEITRCPLEIQDVLLSVLSDRVMAISELPEANRSLFARARFNIIATANARDRGVNEMSAALKRRFSFETVPPIAEIAQELALVRIGTPAPGIHGGCDPAGQ